MTRTQDAAAVSKRGVRKYVGPLTVAVQELDGWFSYTFAIESLKSKHDITCHSKSRRNKKKKIPLCNNEEVDMDLSAMDDSPVLWIRVDPDMLLIRSLDIQQPDFQWQYQVCMYLSWWLILRIYLVHWKNPLNAVDISVNISNF